MDNDKMMIIGTAAVGLGVCGAITYACHITKSAKPLWALLLLPTVRITASQALSSTEE